MILLLLIWLSFYMFLVSIKEFFVWLTLLMSTGLDKMFEDMSHTSGTPFVSGTKSNSTPASKQFYILVRRVPNEDISNITTCTATNVFFLWFDSVLFIFNCWFLFVCLFVCFFFLGGGEEGEETKKGWGLTMNCFIGTVIDIWSIWI